jgi:hypothetical protein
MPKLGPFCCLTISCECIQCPNNILFNQSLCYEDTKIHCVEIAVLKKFIIDGYVSKSTNSDLAGFYLLLYIRQHAGWPLQEKNKCEIQRFSAHLQLPLFVCYNNFFGNIFNTFNVIT